MSNKRLAIVMALLICFVAIFAVADAKATVPMMSTTSVEVVVDIQEAVPVVEAGEGFMVVQMGEQWYITCLEKDGMLLVDMFTGSAIKAAWGELSPQAAFLFR